MSQLPAAQPLGKQRVEQAELGAFADHELFVGLEALDRSLHRRARLRVLFGRPRADGRYPIGECHDRRTFAPVEAAPYRDESVLELCESYE